MNWYKLLNDAWKSYSNKEKAKGKYDKSKELQSFGNDYKKRIKTIVCHLKNKDYEFGQWRAFFRHKKDGGKRLITTPKKISDNIVLKALSNRLSSSLSQKFRDVQYISYAYQKGKNTRDALIQLQKIHHPSHILLKIDIRKFFDEIDINILRDLIETICLESYVTDLILKGIKPDIDYSTIGKDGIEQIPKGGIPQGNPISAVLSNLYLLGLDQLALSEGWKMIRYADDMVFSVADVNEAHRILSEVEKYLKDERKLRIHPLMDSSDSKTAILQDLKTTNLKYLGVNFDGEKLFPTHECCCCLISKIKKIIISNDSNPEANIRHAISQWCGYYAFTNIEDSRLREIGRRINYQIKKHKLDIKNIDIASVMKKIRRRQNMLFKRVKYSDESAWLYLYD